MTALPDPPVPGWADVRHFDDMPLNIPKLRQSSLVAQGDLADNFLALMLWGASWHQVPAGSLPDNERDLCYLAGLGRDIRTWKKHRAGALRGFLKCSDGRLYHPVVCEKVLEALRKSRSGQAAALVRWAARINQDIEKPKNEECAGDAPRELGAMPGKGEEGKGEEGKGKDADDAGAQARAKARALGIEILSLAGLDPNDGWAGTASGYAEVWITRGLDPEFEIIPTIQRVMARKRDGPPSALRYFDKALQQALNDKASNGAVTINGKTGEIEQNVPRRSDRKSPHQAHADAFARAAAKLADPNRA